MFKSLRPIVPLRGLLGSRYRANLDIVTIRTRSLLLHLCTKRRQLLGKFHKVYFALGLIPYLVKSHIMGVGVWSLCAHLTGRILVTHYNLLVQYANPGTSINDEVNDDPRYRWVALVFFRAINHIPSCPTYHNPWVIVSITLCGIQWVCLLVPHLFGHIPFGNMNVGN